MKLFSKSSWHRYYSSHKPFCDVRIVSLTTAHTLLSALRLDVSPRMLHCHFDSPARWTCDTPAFWAYFRSTLPVSCLTHQTLQLSMSTSRAFRNSWQTLFTPGPLPPRSCSIASLASPPCDGRVIPLCFLYRRYVIGIRRSSKYSFQHLTMSSVKVSSAPLYTDQAFLSWVPWQLASYSLRKSKSLFPWPLRTPPNPRFCFCHSQSRVLLGLSVPIICLLSPTG